MNRVLPKVNANKEKVLVNKKDLGFKVKSFSEVVYFRFFLCKNSPKPKGKVGDGRFRFIYCANLRFFPRMRTRAHACILSDKQTP